MDASRGVVAVWDAFWEWAWARHHNVLSWYVRPLFLIPFAWFAFRRRPVGIALTLVALLTSMFWFPAPEVVDPQVVQFLAAEQTYLTGPWTMPKVLLTLAVPLSLWALGAAFWRRSWRAGVLVLVLIAVAKTAWSVWEAGASGWAVAAPALVGLVACVVAVTVGVVVARRRTMRDQGVSASPR